MKSTDQLLVIDVRSPGEFIAAHVKDSINLPLEVFAQKIEQLAPDRNAPIVLCCASGARSGMACAFMQQHGYTQVSNGGGATALARILERPLVNGA
jgi:phage shock protein E